MKIPLLSRALRLSMTIIFVCGFAVTASAKYLFGQSKTVSATEFESNTLLAENPSASGTVESSEEVATGSNLAISSGIENAPEVVPFEIPGLKVGESIPEIELRDQHGEWVNVQSLLLQSPVALVFYRSANWCPYCKRHLVKLQRELKKFQDAELQVVAISYDKVSDLRVFATKKSIEFPMLSDDGSKIIREMGLEFERGLPHPGTMIVDCEGVIRSKLFMQGYKKRHSNDETIAAFQDLQLLTEVDAA